MSQEIVNNYRINSFECLIDIICAVMVELLFCCEVSHTRTCSVNKKRGSGVQKRQSVYKNNVDQILAPVLFKLPFKIMNRF